MGKYHTAFHTIDVKANWVLLSLVEPKVSPIQRSNMAASLSAYRLYRSCDTGSIHAATLIGRRGLDFL